MGGWVAFFRQVFSGSIVDLNLILSIYCGRFIPMPTILPLTEAALTTPLISLCK